MAEAANLAQRLGYPADAKLVIINADDLGSCHSANVGVFECLATGTVTSATLMVPCPWAREASSRYRGEDVGVHLTLNAEYELYRWGPITHAPSLLGGDGGFPSTVEDVWDHADLDEVRRECRAQIERAILWGFDVSHIDSHMGTLQLRPEFFDVYLDLAVEFGLPLRMAGPATERYSGFPARAVAAEAGAVFTDHFRYVGGVGTRQTFERDFATLRPGRDRVPAAPGRGQRRAALTRHGRLDATSRRLRDDLQRGLGPPLPRRRRCHPHRVPATARSGPGRRLSHQRVIRTSPTTIQGVSILSRQKKRGTDEFELVLSHEGIEVRRPERPAQLMSWDRVSEWEIEERKGYVLLTLRGQGATTPLVVPGWTLDDLEILMRDVTSGSSADVPDGPEPVVAQRNERGTGAAVAVVATAAPATPAPATPSPVQAAPPPESDAPAPAVPTRAERRQTATRGAWRRRFTWRTAVTVALLGVLAAAVILVLLQSAGVIDWSFLGPVA